MIIWVYNVVHVFCVKWLVYVSMCLTSLNVYSYFIQALVFYFSSVKHILLFWTLYRPNGIYTTLDLDILHTFFLYFYKFRNISYIMYYLFYVNILDHETYPYMYFVMGFTILFIKLNYNFKLFKIWINFIFIMCVFRFSINYTI